MKEWDRLVGRGRARRGDQGAQSAPAPTGADAPAAVGGAQPPTTLTERIQRAFATFVDPETRRPFSPEAVAAGIAELVGQLPEEEREGRHISRSYLYHLKDGTRNNPTVRHLESIAAFFRSHGYAVEADFFLSDSVYRRVLAERVHDELHDAGATASFRARVLSDAGINDLSEAGLNAVLAAVRTARQMEAQPGPTSSERDDPTAKRRRRA